jgi:hypothetical protein
MYQHGSVHNETKVVRNRSAQFRVTIVSCDSVCDLQFKTTVLSDEIIVSSFMKPISCNWFFLCMTHLKELIFRMRGEWNCKLAS